MAVASRSLATAKTFAEKFSIDRAYGSYEELAADTEVQIVYIGNLNVDHYNTAKLFLEAGKHVLMEKPLTMNTKREFNDCLYCLQFLQPNLVFQTLKLSLSWQSRRTFSSWKLFGVVFCLLICLF